MAPLTGFLLPSNTLRKPQPEELEGVKNHNACV